jgi:UDP-N-acetyl-D-mannosaminuronic acid transferase (WecB/TagA/CpsF family)
MKPGYKISSIKEGHIGLNQRFILMGYSHPSRQSGRSLRRFGDFFKEEGVDLIVTPNSEIIVNALQDTELKAILQSASLVIPDASVWYMTSQ